jgi:hypothetical protein
MGRRWRIREQLLDDLKETTSYWKLKEEALDRTVWRTRFGRSCAPVVRQSTEWMNEWRYDKMCVNVSLKLVEAKNKWSYPSPQHRLMKHKTGQRNSTQLLGAWSHKNSKHKIYHSCFTVNPLKIACNIELNNPQGTLVHPNPISHRRWSPPPFYHHPPTITKENDDTTKIRLFYFLWIHKNLSWAPIITPMGTANHWMLIERGEVRMFTMHHRTLIRTLQRVCVCVQNFATSRETSSFIYDTRVA